MVISPISFAGTTPGKKTFNDILNQPQAYRKEQPNAATGIGKEKKKNSLGKKILKTAGVIAGVVAALAIGHKTGIFEKALSAIEKINNAQIKSALTFVMSLPEKAGKKICDWGSKLFSVFSKKSPEVLDDAIEAVEGKAPKTAEAAQEVATKAAEAVQGAATKAAEAAQEAATKAAETVQGAAEAMKETAETVV